MALQLKSKMFALAAAFSALTGTAAAQDFSFGWNPRSGDVWVDNQLDDINRYGARYREPFADEMVRYYGAPRDLVNELLVTRRWAPGDVYYACSIAHALGRPCRYVVDEWDRSHGKGWGVVARDLGIKPGSAEFHRLKRGFVPSFDRWARPIVIDADLRKDFPNRGGANKPANGGSGHGKAPAASGKAATPRAAPKAKAPGGDHGRGHGAPLPGKGDRAPGSNKGQGKGGKGGKG